MTQKKYPDIIDELPKTLADWIRYVTRVREEDIGNADKLQQVLDGGAENVSYSNTTSGLAATDVQAAIDELVVDIAAVTTLYPFRSVSTTTTLIASDKGGTVELTGSTNRTWDATAAATLGAGWKVEVSNNSSANILFDPNGAETIDSVTNITIYPGEIREINTNAAGTAFVSRQTKIGTANRLVVRDEKASGTNGGSSSSATNHTRDLNTSKLNTITGASLGSNQITLPAGTYKITASAPMVCDGAGGSFHQAFLYNTTDSAVTLVGTSENVDGTTGTGLQSRSHVNGIFSITAQKVLELRHYNQSAEATFGLGYATSSGNVEVYAEVDIEKLA